MASEWKTYPMGNAPLQIIDGDRGKNYPSQSEFTSNGHCLFLNAGNVTSLGFDFSNSAFISQERDALLRKGKLLREDLVLTTRGTVGNVAYFGPSVLYQHLRINSGMVIVRSFINELHPRFLYLQMRSEVFQSQLKALSTGSAQPQLPIRDMNKIEIVVPPLEDQQLILSVLGALDDRIEILNHNATLLEAIARAIFKSWFVDFDPVRAKAEGREPEGMDAATAALFPRRFWESSMGPLPEGFEVVELSSACSISMGQSPPGSTYNELEAGMPFYQGRADFTQMFPTRRVYCTEPTRFASKGDVLLSVRAPVGDINIALEDCAIGRGVAAVRHNSASTAYSWCLLKSLEAAFDSFDTEGTVFGAISGKDLKGLRIVSPSPMLVESYTFLCEPLFDKLRANELQSRSLTELRDTLLPRLISGKLRVPEAEAMLSEVL